MATPRSITVIAVSLLAAGSMAALRLDEVVGRVAGDRAGSPTGIETAPITVSRPLEALATASPWLSSVPGGARTLRGKVVVVNFWTYSCINSLRALSYLRAWDQRYRDRGLVVVGVHAPEFAFEKDAARVRAAISDLRIHYANVQDNNYATWQRFGNQGWPGFYFIDAQGRVRGYRLGEGNYAAAEQLIRKLLTEAGSNLSQVRATAVIGTGIEAPADWQDLQSPESYVGYAKAENFQSPGGLMRDVSQRYGPATELALNDWDLSGTWAVGSEYAALAQASGAIRFRFHARDLHLVLGGAADGKPVRFRVLIDGDRPGSRHGTDVDEAGWGEVTQDRLYQLVRQPGEVADHIVTVEFSRPGARVYVFTFG